MEEKFTFEPSGFGKKQEPIDYKARLNPAQYKAVTTLDGPILVVAGAGSGKTRTLVYRVAYLVDQGVPPESILLLTFTRKAAAEMLTRAASLVGDRCARVSGGTFHSLANELLRRWAKRLGYPTTFGIMDRGDMEEVLGRLRTQAGLGKNDRRFPRRSTLATIVSKAVNKGLSIEDLVLQDFVHQKRYLREIESLAQEYAAYKQENALLDFDDLLVHLARFLAKDIEAREKIAAAYQYVMVDEYQDTNLIQAEIVDLLGRGHGNVMVVGDDAQSIYSFRGASFKNIMTFPEHFPGTRLVRLEENYRSRQPILNVTNEIISQAREQYSKHLFTRRPGGDPPRLLVLKTVKEQSLFICAKVRELMDQGVDPARMAVLFRAASHSFDLEVELTRHNIDFVKYGGRRFLESAHIKDILSLLRVVSNPRDGVSLSRGLLLLEGVGPKTAGKIISWVDGQRQNLLALAEYPGKDRLKKTIIPLAAFYSEIGGKGVGMQERVGKAWDFYRPIMEAKFDDYPQRSADIKEFLRLAKNYTNLNRFLTDMTLEPPNVSGSSSSAKDQQGRLVLSTVHSAKGLEWKIVFIISAVEGYFPPPYALKPEDIDEERRLMYVAATRAEDSLYILCPLETERGRDALYSTGPRISRFVDDIPPELVAFSDEPTQNEKPEAHLSRPAAPPRPGPSGVFAPGERVSHPTFGLGRVLRLVGGKKVRVDFDHYGTKTLHLDYARLKRAG